VNVKAKFDVTITGVDDAVSKSHNPQRLRHVLIQLVQRDGLERHRIGEFGQGSWRCLMEKLK